MDASIDAFILTRQWIETDAGLELIFWLASAQGPLRLRIPAQEAVSFIAEKQLARLHRVLGNSATWRCQKTELKNFAGEAVCALYFSSQRRLLDARDRLAAEGVLLLEADIKPTDRFLMERFVTGSLHLICHLQAQSGFREASNAVLAGAEYRPELRAVSIDIETDLRAASLYSIALYSQSSATVLMVGDEPNRALEAGEPQPVLRFFPDEKALLSAFTALIAQLDPDVIIGWNVVNFDLRCLQQFAERAGQKLPIGRNSEPITWRQSRDGNERFYALVPGRLVLDGIDLMRSATYQFENFSLEHVARSLLGRGKLVDDVDQRGVEITELFTQDKKALAIYNLEDCRLVWDIFQQERLFDFAIERSLLTGLEADRYGGSVAAFDFLYLPRLHRQGYVAPVRGQSDSSTVSPGGYVMQSVPGIHDNVIVLDFKSLYPSIIRTFRVDPLALVKGQKEDDAIPGFDGGVFSRHHDILPQLIERLWQARDHARKAGNKVLANAIKIIMNSFYGVLGSSGCRFFDPRLVSSITRRGHDIIIQSKQFIEEQGLQVIYGDTDSVFVLLGDVPGSEVEPAGRTLAASLNQWWRDRLSRDYGLQSFLEIEFETHFQRFLMPRVRGAETGSKKRYAGLVTGNRVVFKGLESVRSDWSPLAREFQKVLYQKIFLEEPYEAYVKKVVEKLRAGEFEAELVLRKRLRRKLTEYVKNVPPHVQAARKAEAVRSEKGLPALYQSGGWIEYLMTVNGPEPRQYRRSVIDYDFYIEKQLAPIADSILVFRTSSLEAIINRQMGLL